MGGAAARQDPVEVAFVGGIGRSGSTLLCRVLGQVPGVVHVGEICYLWNQSVRNNRLCSCGRPFLGCPFWTEVGSAAFGGWDAVDVDHADRLRRGVERNRQVGRLAFAGPGSTYGRAVAEYAELTGAVLRAVRDVSGARVVVDNSKLPSSAYLRRRTPGLDLRLLHLVRSSHGVCYSWSKTMERDDLAGRTMPRFPPVRSAAEWSAYNALLDSLGTLGVPRLLVRYEDVVSAPRPAVERVLDFLGVVPGPGDLDFIAADSVTLGADHAVWGNPSRLRTGPQQLREDLEWRRALGRGTRSAITALTLPGLVRYGYLPAR